MIQLRLEKLWISNNWGRLSIKGIGALAIDYRGTGDSGSSNTSTDPVILKLKQLLDAGAITQDQFDAAAKRKELKEEIEDLKKKEYQYLMNT